ncbi:BF3164 family lipoprotein [Pedobacter gandavensis]|uniref:BF3164 family lipoprotein n=1 Tax=Pedobacter gandavensis TaxID=2679963 RepID=UPI00160419AE|nr:BF3164 family lipoprotein [Pedobacter gandavensis]
MIVVLFSSCHAKNEFSNGTVVFSEFPKSENVTFNEVIKFEYGDISRMFLRDTSLIVYNWRAKGGCFFYEYGLNSKRNVGKAIPAGSGKGKALGSLSAGVDNNEVWMYDISLNKIIFSALTNPSLPAATASYREYPFSPDYYNIQFLDSSRVIANGNYKTPNKIQEIDLHSGKILADYGVLDSVPKDIPFYAYKRVKEAFLVLKPTKDKVVLAHRLSDQIEIFDLKSHKSITVKGPENFKVEFKFFKSVDQEDVIGRDEGSRYAFIQAAATNKFIYVLYSGYNMSSQFVNCAKTIYVYDWDGKPVKKINLDRDVSSITVGNDDQTLYAFDMMSKFIVHTKI